MSGKPGLMAWGTAMKIAGGLALAAILFAALGAGMVALFLSIAAATLFAATLLEDEDHRDARRRNR